MKRQFVLDAWALLAFLQKEEPAAAEVKRLLAEAATRSARVHMSIVNVGEVYYRIGRAKGEVVADQTLADIRRLPLSIVPVTEVAVLAAARLKMRYAISYADAFALAAADALSGTLVTGDPELASLQRRVRLKWLSRSRDR
jgi:ribonuclease VapC